MKRLMITGIAGIFIALCSGCEWTGGGGVDYWDGGSGDWVDFSGSYKAADGGYLVTQFGTGADAVAVTNIVSDELIGTGNDTDTAFGGLLAHPPMAGSLNIEVGSVGGNVFWDHPGGSGTVSLDGSPDDGSSGTINYDTGAWSLSFPAPLTTGTRIIASYVYHSGGTSTHGNTGAPIYSFVVYQTGNKLQIVDSNGASYEGTIGSFRTAVGYGYRDDVEIPEVTTVEAAFSAYGVSQAGLNVTIVGVLQGRKKVGEDGEEATAVYFDRVMNATYIEEGGETADIRAIYR